MKSVVQEASSIAKAIELGLAKADNPRDFSIKILEYPERNFFGITTKSARIALYWDDKTAAKSNEPHPIPTLEKQTQGGRSREFRDRQGHERSTSDRNERPARYEGQGQSRREQGSSSRSSERSERPERSEYRERRDTREHTPRDNKERSEPRLRETREARETREPRDMKEQRESSESRDYKELRTAPEIREKNIPIATPVEGFSSEESQVEEQRVPLWNSEIIAYMETWLRRVLNGLHKEDVTFTMEQQEFCVRIILSQHLADEADQERKILASLSLLLLETSRHLFKVNLRGHKVLLTHQASSYSRDHEAAS